MLSCILYRRWFTVFSERYTHFLFWSRLVAPLGFEKTPQLVFSSGILATSLTCDLVVRIPIEHGSDYSKLKEAMILSIHDHDGFGGV